MNGDVNESPDKAALDEMLAEDERRRRRRHEAARRTPLRGHREEGRTGSLIKTPEADVPCAYLPETMVRDPEYKEARHDVALWRRLRCRHDFEYWCYRCVTIRHKTQARDVAFVLNRAQRQLLKALESDRLSGRPIRVILLKARQWGGSTLVQVYMAWIQSCHKRNWNSLICAHVKDAAATIRSTYSKLLEHYPEEYMDGDEKLRFKPFERSLNVREITGRGCRVTISSSENQDAVRGSDYAMAHLSETAFWKRTRQRNPEDYIRAVYGAIAPVPMTLIVMESTANGVANYFHSEWQRCKEGRGDKRAVFVPWYMIDIYEKRPKNRRAFAAGLDEYERDLWQRGCDLDQICWYRSKRIEMNIDEKMHAEFPTTDIEAFASTGHHVFAPEAVERLRRGCCDATAVGEVSAGRGVPAMFRAESGGSFRVWKQPEVGCHYVAAVDVGGRSHGSDYSVVAVISQPHAEELPEVVGQWRGHCDHDILAAKAEAIARYYNNALLVVESNTYETEYYGGSGGNDANMFVLNRLAERYGNVYMRECFDSLTNRQSVRVGFHTNRHTKMLVISELVEMVREGGYIERDGDACDEYLTYEQLPNGTLAAAVGYHDDILMTRALGLHVVGEGHTLTAGHWRRQCW